SMLSSIDRAARTPVSQKYGLLFLRITTAGLLLWWGLVKGLNLGFGQAVSDKYYAGTFTADVPLIVFGWLQVAAAVSLALGLFRSVVLWLQLAINLFVAIVVWQSLIDPFWIWMPAVKPETHNGLFYPSIIVLAASWVLIALRDQDELALDRRMSGRDGT
ncbi:MAG: hypothetical protein ACR2OM_04215, partial [Aestuariivirgaceae bacterium]